MRLVDGNGPVSEVHWSPDGKRLLFAAGSEAQTELWVVRADGSGLRRLTANSARETTPSWSPDGSSIAFVSDRDGNLEIYTLRVGR